MGAPLLHHQYAKLTRESVLEVHAHYDDLEVFNAGTVAQIAARGGEVRVAYMTRCPGGTIFDPQLAKMLTTDKTQTTETAKAAHRRGEVDRAGKALGLAPGAEVHFGYDDSGMARPGDLGYPAGAFFDVPNDVVVGRLVRMIREQRPTVVVTYDAKGTYGHPDHRKAHLVTVLAVKAAADPDYHPEFGPAHEVAKLYYTYYSRDQVKVARQAAKTMAGEPDPLVGNQNGFFTSAKTRMNERTRRHQSRVSGWRPPASIRGNVVVDLRGDGAAIAAKQRAILEYRSQLYGFSMFEWILKAPQAWLDAFGVEHFHLLGSRVPVDRTVSADLFEGIPDRIVPSPKLQTMSDELTRALRRLKPGMPAVIAGMVDRDWDQLIDYEAQRRFGVEGRVVIRGIKAKLLSPTDLNFERMGFCYRALSPQRRRDYCSDNRLEHPEIVAARTNRGGGGPMSLRQRLAAAQQLSDGIDRRLNAPHHDATALRLN